MLRVESYKRGIILSTGFNILNKGLVFLNGLLVAYFFGVQAGTDLFFYVYNSVLILGAFFTSINATVVIPESMRLRSEEGEESSGALLNFFLFLYIGVTAIALALIAANPVGFFRTVSHFDSADLHANSQLLYLSIPLFGMICIINLCVDILISYKFFTIPMVIGIINGLSSILFMLLFHLSFGIKSVLFGLLLSYSLNILLLMALMKKYLDWNFTNIKVVRQSRIWKNFGFAQLGNITSTASNYMPMYFLSAYNTGVITALTFAQQISTLPTMLITYQFSSVAGIKFNELYAKKQFQEIKRVFAESANFLHFLMIPLSCFVFYFSADIVQILLGFTSLAKGASWYVALFLKFLGFLLPLMVINSLIARMFMASHKIKESFWYQTLFNIVLIGAMYIAVKRLGVVGYPLSVVVAYSLNLLFSYFIEKYYFGVLNYKRILVDFGIMLLVNAIISTAVFYFVENIHLHNAVLRIGVAFFIYLFALLFVNFLLKINTELTRQLLLGFSFLKKRVNN